MLQHVTTPAFVVTRCLVYCCLLLLAGGCTTYGTIENRPLAGAPAGSSYSIGSFHDRLSRGEVSVLLAFSGGGTRAAALSYGVLKALHEIRVVTEQGEKSLLDAVDSITSVSGGSFTSAYYGLFGERIFVDYEADFLRRDVQGELLHRLVNPINWFRLAKRTEWAVQYYEEHIFKGATFADLLRAGGPMILINASDLSAGIGFWFTQEYFDLLCSDIRDFPVSRAVAASSAVPGVFAPVVLQNFSDCPPQAYRILAGGRGAAAHRPEMEMVLQGLESYTDKERRPYIHLVDGGITDNLGLRGVHDITQLVAEGAGGATGYYRSYGRKPHRRMIAIAVDASTEPEYGMNRSSRVPPVGEVVAAMSDVQLHRYNAATLALAEDTLERWSRELSTPGHPVDAHLIRLDIRQLEDPATRAFLNSIPTSFSLTGEQVDALIAAGGELLRNHPEFRRLLAETQLAPPR